MIEAQKIIKEKNMKKKKAIFKDINFKFKCPDFTYGEKNNFMEFNIEDSFKSFGQRHNDKQMKEQYYLKKVKKQVTNNIFYWKAKTRSKSLR